MDSHSGQDSSGHCQRPWPRSHDVAGLYVGDSRIVRRGFVTSFQGIKIDSDHIILYCIFAVLDSTVECSASVVLQSSLFNSFRPSLHNAQMHEPQYIAGVGTEVDAQPQAHLLIDSQTGAGPQRIHFMRTYIHI